MCLRELFVLHWHRPVIDQLQLLRGPHLIWIILELDLIGYSLLVLGGYHGFLLPKAKQMLMLLEGLDWLHLIVLVGLDKTEADQVIDGLLDYVSGLGLLLELHELLLHLFKSSHFVGNVSLFRLLGFLVCGYLTFASATSCNLLHEVR